MRYSHLQISQYCIESYRRHDGQVGNFQYIHPHPDLLIFRGTDQLRDILSDWRMILHWRFRRELEPLFEEVLELDLQFPITVGGHSMGADIAKVFAWWFEQMGYSVNQVVVFAPPRTGKYPMRAPYIGHRNGNDGVTYVPGIRHQAPLVQLSRFSLRFLSRHRMSEYHFLMKKKYGVSE